MSKIPVSCPECKSILKVSTEVIGKKAKCPKCQAVIRLLPQETTVSEDAVSPESTSAAVQPETPVKPSQIVKKAKKEIAAESSKTETTAEPIPMAKLIPAAASTPSIAEPLASQASLNLNQIDSLVASKPKVKFKPKRSNPLPTIILGVIALSILGIAIALIAISQNNRATTATSDALPTIQFVSDITTAVGKTVIIPVKIQFPLHMTMQQTQEWKVALSKNAPQSAVYDAANEQVTWSPTFHEAGEDVTIEAIVQHSTSGQSNSTRFNVKVEAILLGEKELLAWAEMMEEKGTKVVLSETQKMEALSGNYRDLSFDGISVRAFLYNDAESPKVAYASLEPDGDAFRRAFAGINEPLLISPVGGMFLIGNVQDVKRVTEAAKLFQTDPNVLPDSDSVDAQEEKPANSGTEASMPAEKMESKESVNP